MVLDSNSCILCGRARGRLAVLRDKCKCVSMTHCPSCKSDDKQIGLSRRSIKPLYNCKTHGKFRTYVDYLSGLKNWCLMWSVLSIVPLTVLLKILNLSLAWLYLFMGILIGSAVLPIVLCMFWERLTGMGMIAGSISGTCTALVSWLVVASFYQGGLSRFLENTGKELPMLIGNITSICVGGFVCVVVSLVQSRQKTTKLYNETWELTRDIDSPLSPWTELYATDLDLREADSLDCRPDIDHIKKKFRMSSVIAVVGSVAFTSILILIWPAIMTSTGVFNSSEFNSWITVAQVWAFTAAIFIIVVPLVTEGIEIAKTYKQNTTVQSEISIRAPELSCKGPDIKILNERLNVICNGFNQSSAKYENAEQTTADKPSCSDDKI